MSFLLGYDIGSSSIKVALVDAKSKEVMAIVKYPETEMEITCPVEGWAEQDPEMWWDNLCHVTKSLLESTGIDGQLISAIGISYQMHGLVLVDKNQHSLRPAIIWCDSRAVNIGEKAFEYLGNDFCAKHYLNNPGNFTASKLKWVKDNEPEIYAQVYKAMLPGDFIAMKLSGEICTTISSLSEGIFWDYSENQVSQDLLDYYGIDKKILPPIVSNLTQQSVVQKSVSDRLGIKSGIPICYRAGDQVNNAVSLSVFSPGEVAATGGTSGVVYAVVDKYIYDKKSRVNAFVHVNHKLDQPRVGILLCINGAGIQYSWIKKQLVSDSMSYSDLEQIMASIPAGSEGLRILPFGNGSERMLSNRNLGAQINNLQFNIHRKEHLYRAALEGIAFSFVYGVEILREMGLELSVIKVGNDNLFQSRIFSSTISNLLKLQIEIYNTTGAVGAALASGVGIGMYKDLNEAIGKQSTVDIINPEIPSQALKEVYQLWKNDLEKMI